MKSASTLLLLFAAPLVGAAPLVQDGGFEAGAVPTYWTSTSTNFGTPICDASCGGVGPRTGTYWAWFGGAGTAAEAGSVEQTGELSTGPKTLTSDRTVVLERGHAARSERDLHRENGR